MEDMEEGNNFNKPNTSGIGSFTMFQLPFQKDAGGEGIDSPLHFDVDMAWTDPDFPGNHYEDVCVYVGLLGKCEGNSCRNLGR